MLDETKYPHFIPDKPQGEDVFEGKSQEHLAASICNYVKSIDATPDKKDGVNMPRIVGLEGSWGSGKSNVVSMIEKELTSVGYYTFTYDAWGHQEDLQRRSILENLAGKLIGDKVLQGKVTILMRNGKPHTDTWSNQLSLLLSNKTTTIRKSTPKLTPAAFWGIGIVALFAICSLVASQMIENTTDFCRFWWIDFIPIILAFLVAGWYRIRDGSFENISRMVDHTNNDTIDEEYTSSEEPSVAEFKNWMYAVSNYLGNSKGQFKKLIIVFDNMDRLPSEKVMQLWSCIYTFFAGGEFENVWTFIPYDYKHLCQAITGQLNGEDDDQRIKRFINKTFPITYIVPQPVITDYEKLFYTYFDKAFGKKEHDRKHICQVFMRLRKNPNPRTVISFVNELVALRMQWPDSGKYRLQNLALFILKKDFLFYNEGVEDKKASLESNLLSDDLFNDIAYYYPDSDGIIRRQMCQFAYGLEDETLAGELPLRLELQRLLSEGGSIKEYVSQPNFVTVLERVLSDTETSVLDKSVTSMLSLDGIDFGDEQSSIQSKWDMLANQKVASVYHKQEYDQTLDILIRHTTETRVKNLCKSYCRAMHKLSIENGGTYYDALHSLKSALESIKSKIRLFDFIIPITTTPEHFVEFLNKAGKDYKDYKLTVNNKELNEFLLNNAISGSDTSAMVYDQLKDDKDYKFEYLKEHLAKTISAGEIKADIRPAAYINRSLNSEDGIIQSRFTAAVVSELVEAARTPWNDKSSLGSEDVLAMYLADGKDIADVDDSIIPRLSECIERYIESDDLLTHIGSPGTAYNKLNAYMIQNKKGQHISFSYYAKNILIIRDGLGLEVKNLLDYSNDWEYKEIEGLNASNIQEYFHQELFADYLASTGDFTDGLIKQGVSILETQDEGFLIRISPNPSNPRVPILVVNPYWKQFVLTFVGTKFIPKLNELLTKELITMLKRVVDSNAVEEQALLRFLLSHDPVDAIMRDYLNDVMNNQFAKTDASVTKFKVFGELLPVLTPDMDVNTARNLVVHFIKPVYKDKECAQIIVANKDFYLGILTKDAPSAQEVLKGIIGEADTSDIYEVIKGEIGGFIIKEEEVDSSEKE